MNNIEKRLQALETGNGSNPFDTGEIRVFLLLSVDRDQEKSRWFEDRDGNEIAVTEELENLLANSNKDHIELELIIVPPDSN